jgi:hypothetical protein
MPEVRSKMILICEKCRHEKQHHLNIKKDYDEINSACILCSCWAFAE